jgi:hypothetical protein
MSIDDKMNNSKNKAQEAATSRAFGKTKHPKQSTKKDSMLKTFIKLGNRGMKCFEAANRHNDYVLRTTVSDLNRDYGIEFEREWEKVPNAFGKTTVCLRYWLDENNITKALVLLGNDISIGGM